MSMKRKHPTSNIQHRTSKVRDGNELSYRVLRAIARGCFVRHSPLPGANDEQSRLVWDCYPGLRLLRSLTLGYHLSPFQGWELVGAKLSGLIQRWNLRGGFDL